MEMVLHVGLRSIGKKNNKVITIALWVAIVVHVFAWFYWHPIQRILAPEIPDWINITLVAGFEEQPEPVPRVKPAPPKPQTVPVKQVKAKPVKKPQKKIAEVKPTPPPEAIEEVSEPASASTFVQADSKPFTLDNPKPVYPSSARRRGMQGVVLLQVSVSDKGKVTGIHVMRSSGFRLLDVAALNSVKQWRFMPARKGNTEVASTVQVPIRFILNKS